MGLPQQKTHYMTEQEYLDSEKLREIRHEYIDGEIYAMSGGKLNHQRLISRFVQKIGNHLEGTPCEVFSSDIKVRADEGNKYFYPDVLVSCNNEDGDSVFTESPRLIIEVLSKSTRKYDKTFKRICYQAIPTLEEYVLVEQDHVEIEVCRKSQKWQPNYYFIDDEITFESIALTLSVLDIYKRVENQELREFHQSNSQEANHEN